MSGDPNCTTCKGTGYTVRYMRSGYGAIYRCRCNPLPREAFSYRANVKAAMQYIKKKYSTHGGHAWPKKEDK